MIKAWQSLSSTERRVLGIGGVIAFLLLGYALIWSPLARSVSTVRSRTYVQQKLLQWMQHAHKRIQQLKNEGFSAKQNSDQAILVLAEKTLTQRKLSRYLQQVQQPEANELTLKFHKIPFDQLMNWLQMLTHQDSIKVQKFSANKTSPVGTVNTQITLTQNN
jgi:general secretion pathway protein M